MALGYRLDGAAANPIGRRVLVAIDTTIVPMRCSSNAIDVLENIAREVMRRAGLACDELCDTL